MKIGTKSVLFGAHAFWLHPFFVAAAWWKLYGFPTQPWLWIAFFVHDIGYWGKPNMDEEEGEQHPVLGANILYWLERWLHRFGWKKRMTGKWGNECLYHSRFWANKNGMMPSNLCWADKLAFVMMPRWLYLPMARLTGELALYMTNARVTADIAQSFPAIAVIEMDPHSSHVRKTWFLAAQEHMRRQIKVHAKA